MSGAETSDNVEHTFPGPPSYYKYCFDSDSNKESHESDSTLQPPSIDSINDPYSVIYGGALAQVREKARPFDSERDYRVELKILLKSVLTKALSFTSYNDPQTDEITEKVLDFKTTLVEIHKVLEDFRVHEARELLCNSMQMQLEDIKSVEESLEKTVAHARSLIDGA